MNSGSENGLVVPFHYQLGFNEDLLYSLSAGFIYG